jgi:hypothetical protein
MSVVLQQTAKSEFFLEVEVTLNSENSKNFSQSHLNALFDLKSRVVKVINNGQPEIPRIFVSSFCDFLSEN